MFYKFLTPILALTSKQMEPKRLCLTVSWHPNGRAKTAAPKRLRQDVPFRRKMGMSRPYLKIRFKIEYSKPSFRQYCFTVKPTLILTYTEKNSFTYSSIMVNACVTLLFYFIIYFIIFTHSLNRLFLIK